MGAEELVSAVRQCALAEEPATTTPLNRLKDITNALCCGYTISLISVVIYASRIWISFLGVIILILVLFSYVFVTIKDKRVVLI